MSTGVLAATESSDITSLDGYVHVASYFTSSELPDSFTANADVIIKGSLVLQEQNDRLPSYSNDYYVAERYFERTINGKVIVSGALVLQEDADSFVGTNLVTKEVTIVLRRIKYQSANEEIVLPQMKKVAVV